MVKQYGKRWYSYNQWFEGITIKFTQNYHHTTHALSINNFRSKTYPTTIGQFTKIRTIKFYNNDRLHYTNQIINYYNTLVKKKIQTTQMLSSAHKSSLTKGWFLQIASGHC